MDGIELRFTDISAPPPTHTQVTHQTYAYTSSNGRTVQHTTSSNDYKTPITQAKWFKPAIIAAVIILLVAILILIIVLPIVLTSKSNSLDTKSTNTTSIVTTSNTTTGWTRTGNMTASRRSHTASVLPNGKVLITGGYTADSNVPLATAEVYDPSTRTWTKTQNNMNYGRIGHSASVLSNGTVLVTGAYEIFATELYDPTTNTWIQRASMNISRVSHTASVLSNGTVVVIGGYDSSFEAIENNAMGYVNTTELYDPSKNMWAKVAKMNTARAYHRASTLSDGRILITGGIGGEDSATLNSAELYDPIKNNWTVATNMIIPRTSHTVSVLSNGTVLVIGGYYDSSRVYYNSAELYDPSKNAWTVVANMSVPRASHTASVLSNGKVLVTGGFYGDGNSRVTLNTAELYDPTTNTWTKAANMTVSRTAHTASRLSTGNILIAGGDGGISSDGMSYIGTLNIAELY